MKYLAIDPGNTSGYAEFNERGELDRFGHLKDDTAGMGDYLESITDLPEIVIVEDYRVLGQKLKAHTGSRVVTIKVIGVIDGWARRHGIKVVLQPANIKLIAEKWSGHKPPSDHSQSHKFDALNHGIYYLVKHNVVQPIIVKESSIGKR